MAHPQAPDGAELATSFVVAAPKYRRDEMFDVATLR
jgi:hypothetical protein